MFNVGMEGSAQTRDKAIQQLSQGKRMFLDNIDLAHKEQGYELFKLGLGSLLAYAKKEQNKSIQSQITDKLKQFFNDAIDMDTALKQLYAQRQNNQKQAENDDLIKQKLALVDQKPNIDWDQVCGMEGIKKTLKEAIILPMQFPELFVGIRTPWNGILLYGPPGTGKTYLAKACASLCNITFFAVTASDLMSKYVGDSERLVRKLFEEAREKGQSIIFIDEVDSLLSAREGAEEQDVSKRVKTEFLVQMQGIRSKNQNLLVIGATNQPWILDPAIRRRFEKRIYIPLPSYDARFDMLVKGLAGTQNTLTPLQIEQLAKQTENYSCSDIAVLLREAAYEPLRHCIRATYFRNQDNNIIPCSPTHPGAKRMNLDEVDPLKLELPPIDYDDFMSALITCKPSVNQQDLVRFSEWTKEFGQES